MQLHYEKKKNNKLFSNFETNPKLRIKNIQNYIPIYTTFFSLNETNYNSINLNHKWHVSKILDKQFDHDCEFSCEIEPKNADNLGVKIREKVFIKMAPLLEPYKYLVGKYDISNSDLFNLPTFNREGDIIHDKILDPNNSSYVDSFFCYLSSQLLNCHNIINGIDFYGSFLGLKENYKINVIDDIDYLVESDFFNKNQNKLFQIEDYSHLIYKPQLKRLEILDDVEIVTDDILFDVTDETDKIPQLVDVGELTLELENIPELTDMIDSDPEYDNENISKLDSHNLNSLGTIELLKENQHTLSSSSGSTCSSRSSHTNSHDSEMENSVDETGMSEDDDDINSNCSSTSYSDGSSVEEEMLFATLTEFPIQLICLQCCEGTLDSLILNDDIEHEEILAALMQIIMTLLVYQQTYSFTHNDLHTNNIMYIKTNIKYIYYVYNKKTYKVPTYGKIYKIIDFGRAIYKFNGHVICSDSFKNGNDAATQYNTEPYFNDKKPRLEPNYSFDLCRLACSMFDYFIDDITDSNYETMEPLVKIIFEWCLDDNGVNVLYKNTGVERYPDFKLYKMIARLVHSHTPEAQLERNEFKKYIISSKKKQLGCFTVDIDAVPNYSNA